MSRPNSLVLLLSLLLSLLLLLAGVTPDADASAQRRAILDGSAKRLRAALDAGADVNARHEDGATLLMLAAHLGAAPMVDLLIARDAEVNARTDSGWTALAAAITTGDTGIVERLLAAGAQIDERTRFAGAPPLCIASELGSAPIVKLLLESGAQPDVMSHQHRTPLMLAAVRGHASVVEILLDAGARHTHEDMDRNSALGLAAMEGRLDTARLLIDRGADLNHKNEHGRTPLEIAADTGDDRFIAQFMTPRASIDLNKAVRNKDMSMIRKYLDTGGDVDRDTGGGRTALMSAMTPSGKAVASLLLTHGADVNAVTDRGKSVIWYAVQADNHLAVAMLIDRGVDLHRKIDDLTVGEHALFVACRESWRSIPILVDAGVDVDVRNTKNETPLLVAARQRSTNAVAMLMDRGADLSEAERRAPEPLPEQRNARVAEIISRVGPRRRAARSDSPRAERNPWVVQFDLAIAAEEGDAARVRELLAGQIVPYGHDPDGWTPLAIAAAEGHVDVIKVLLAPKGAPPKAIRRTVSAASGADAATVGAMVARFRGPSPEQIGPGGWTPLMQAAGNGHAAATRALLEHGATLSAENNWGRTALDIARQRGHQEVVALLEKAGAAKTDARALIGGVRWLQPDAFSALVAKTENVSAVDSDDRSALSHAVSLRRREHARILLEHDADPNQPDQPFGRTPLIIALSDGGNIQKRLPSVFRPDPEHVSTFFVAGGEPRNVDVEMVRLLLEHGADPNRKSRHGQTAIDLVKRISDPVLRERMVEMMKRAGPTRCIAKRGKKGKRGRPRSADSPLTVDPRMLRYHRQLIIRYRP